MLPSRHRSLCNIMRSRLPGKESNITVLGRETLHLSRCRSLLETLPKISPRNFLPCLGVGAAPRGESAPLKHQGGDRWAANQALAFLKLRNDEISSRSSIRDGPKGCATNLDNLCFWNQLGPNLRTKWVSGSGDQLSKIIREPSCRWRVQTNLRHI